jgi:hypothetical protein
MGFFPESCAHPGGRNEGCPPPFAATGATETVSINTTNNKTKSFFITITSLPYEKIGKYWLYATAKLSIF